LNTYKKRKYAKFQWTSEMRFYDDFDLEGKTSPTLDFEHCFTTKTYPTYLFEINIGSPRIIQYQHKVQKDLFGEFLSETGSMHLITSPMRDMYKVNLKC
jgi:hypothetical protein